MRNEPLVSVIIIFLNAESFIRDAIESVLAQSYHEWELLLVDDGSTDASEDIARRYTAEQPEQVRYFEHPHHQNCGKGASRNLGIQHARGKYIAFLDADDVWLPRKLGEQVEILESHPHAEMLYGNTLYWYTWTDKQEDSARDFVPSLGVTHETLFEPPTLLPHFLRGKAAVPCTCSIILRRDTVLRVGGFEAGYRGIYNIYEDQAFYAKVCLAAPIYVASQCWDKYRQHPDASMATARDAGQEVIARQFYLNWLAGYFEERGILDRELWIALRKELWRTRHYGYPLGSQWSRRTDAVVGWIKKWLLRFEERLLPLSLATWLWYRE